MSEASPPLATSASSDVGAEPAGSVAARRGAGGAAEPVAVAERPRRPVPWFVMLGGDLVLLLVVTLVVVLALRR